MNLSDLFLRLREKQLVISIDRDELVVRGKRASIDQDTLNYLRDHKATIVAYLTRLDHLSDPTISQLVSLTGLSADDIQRIQDMAPGGANNVQDIYPLAPMQEGILFHHLLGNGEDPYLLATAISFDTRERLDGYLNALQSVVNRHDILRTAVMWQGLPEPMQVVLRRAQIIVEEMAIDQTSGDIPEQLRSRLSLRHYRIDITRAPLLRACVAYDATHNKWLMMQLLHHLVGDQTTLGIIHAEIQSHLMGESHLLPSPLPFRNFVAQSRLGVSREDHEIFFQEMLGDVDEPTAPFGLLDVWGDGVGIEQRSIALDITLAKRLRANSRRLGVSVASLCHLAWAQVLAKISGHQDVVFGTVLFGRMQGEGSGRVMGPFINTLPLRIQINEEGAKKSVLRVHALLGDLLGHEHASLALAQRCSAVPPPTPLFSALLNYRHNPDAAHPPSEEYLQAWQGINQLRSEERTNYPVTLSVEDFGERLALTAQTLSSIDPARICEFMGTALESLIDALEISPATPIRQLEVLPRSERDRVLYAWNQTRTEYPSDKCVHQLFEAQVNRTPEAVAVVFEEEELTYAELNRRANQLAHHLRELGVRPDARVAICVERGFEMIVALLAVLKAGGAYVPLDPAYPPERLQFMLQDSAPVALLTQIDLVENFARLADTLPPLLDLGQGDARWSDRPSSNPDPGFIGLTPQHLAYVIYTSGSTGMPKGVMVQHANTVNFLFWAQRSLHAAFFESTLSATSFNFDLAVYELFVPIVTGAKVQLVDSLLTLVDESVYPTLINTVPSAMNLLVAQKKIPETVRVVNLAGEPVKQTLVERIFAQSSAESICNLYGPTETTTYSTWTKIGRDEKFVSHIGRPIANTQIYILDAHREPVPVGVAGELYIGGAGVARGYLNRPELTAERFLSDPFSSDPEARMYRTGDLGRWLPDGNIEFLGRNDFQVKIRGFRIELGEIEARLADYAAIRESVVIAREDTAGDKRLVAYYTAADAGQAEEEALSAEQLRSHLSATLPEYMVPAAYVRLTSLPLTANGKLDRKALPAPDAEAYVSHGYEPPRGEAETVLAGIWADVLQVERVGRHDNFFELGGHSLLAITLIERMRRVGFEVDIRTLFVTPRLAELAATNGGSAESIEVPPNLIPFNCEAIRPDMLPLVQLSKEEVERVVSTVPGGAANVQDIYPLAPLQEGILFHHLLGGDGDPYLLALLLSVDSRAKLDSYLGALQAVVDRNDILRTAVLWEGLPEPVQVVWRKAPLYIEEIDSMPAHGDMAEQLYERLNPRKFRIDVREAPLLRIYLAYDKQNERWLAMHLLHHLAGDHTTLEVMQHEIRMHLLNGSQCLPVPLPFRNLVAQSRLGVSREDHETFFKEMLGDVDEPTAPFGLLDIRGDGVGIEQRGIALDITLAKRLRANSRRLGVSVASLCHLAWAQVLAKISGRQDVVFGTVLFGRMQGGEGSGRVMGTFINTLPLRIQINEEGAKKSVLRVHALLGDLLRHEHASLALAQRCSAVPPPTPLFSALLNYRHNPDAAHPPSEEYLQAWQGINQLRGEERNNYPLTLSVEDFGAGLALIARTSVSIGPLRICEFMGTALESLIDALEISPATPIRQLEVLPRSERDRVLYEWNQTRTEYPSDKCVHQLFEAQVNRTPEAVAVVFEEEELTYAELNRRANQLAHHMRELGVRPDARVAICVERGFEMIVALLAVLKAGGAYVPLDPAYPPERLQFMLQDSAPVALLTQHHLSDLFSELKDVFPVISLDTPNISWHTLDDSNPDSASIGLTSQHLAYVIYTSGSTGMPKGVMVEHRNLVNYLLWSQQSYYEVTGSGSPAIHSIGFDGLITTLFGPLLVGQLLTLLPQGSEMEQVLQCDSVVPYTLLKITPSHLKLLNQQIISADITYFPTHTLMIGGEAIVPSDVYFWQRRFPDIRVVNHFGPTEATVGCSTFEIPRLSGGTGNIPIGRPVANTQIYILDAYREPVPVGVAGELYIGGAGVARGYLNRPELTAERFLSDPFSSDPEARMYRTGDLGRWLPDGNIEFLGRNDFQVKIRGFRIELGEIESRVREYAGVAEAVVIAREDTAGDKRLVAYYTAADAGQAEEEALSAEQLRSHLSATLPEYMVPAAYVRLTSLPLTANGKLDRKALPAPDAEAYVSHGYEPPRGEAETVLAGIWADVLQVERVGRHDNFFELGGHSLLAITLIERMRRVGFEVDIRTLFVTPRLAELAATNGGSAESIEVPPNLIPFNCEAIRPDMLPLVQLSKEEVERVVSTVPGGAANVQDIYPLAPLQEGILFHHLLGGDGDPYLLALLLSVDSRAKLDSYLGALQAVVDRNDILRTAVLWEGLPEPVQVVWRKAPLYIEEIDSMPAHGDMAEQLYERLNPRKFRIDVREAPLLRIYLAYDKQNERWLAMHLRHHLAGDHTTLEVMQHEIRMHLLNGSQCLPMPLPFRNLVAQSRLGVSREDHETFFKEMLGDVDEPTAPFGLLDIRGDGVGIEQRGIALDITLAKRLRANSRRLGVSVASLCHLAWAQVLAKISGRQDVVFGTVLFGRMQGGEGSDRVMGTFINTLPLRIQINEEGAKKSVLRVHALLGDLLRHEHASLALAQRCSAVPPPTPLFSALLNYRHNPDAAHPPSEEYLQAWQGINQLRSEERTNYPVTLSVEDFGERLALTAQTLSSIDPARICEFMGTALESLIDALEISPATPIRQLEVLPRSERDRVLYAWNQTRTEYPSDKCVHQLFEAQVNRTPEAVAVVFEEEELTYAELNRRANQLAHHLRELGVRPDARVAICVERGFEMIVALLAVLKAGGAYVPLDPAYPPERLQFMLQDSAPVALLTQHHLSDLFSELKDVFPVISLDTPHISWHTLDDSNPDPASVGLTSQHLAYVIYTSGSTGQPKGVMVEHREVVNTIHDINIRYTVNSTDKILALSSLAFDLSVYDIFGLLATGGTIVIPFLTSFVDAKKWYDYIQIYGITIWNSVPALMQTVTDSVTAIGGSPCASLRLIMLSGDWIPLHLPKQINSFCPNATVYSLGGATEASIWSINFLIDLLCPYEKSIPYGSPLANQQFYVLDREGEPVPVGVAGELYIGGAGVARGYLNRPELTAERFLSDPFSSDPEARMYRTGDLGRWLPDGNIEFLGRNDFQVKIRGFRIELGEIESRVREYAGVAEAVVIAREDTAGDKRLVAYYTAADAGQAEEEALSAEQLRSHLSATLPEYMVPAAYVRLTSLPLTANGKLDRKALPAPDAEAYVSHGYEPPRGETETVLAGIWADVLQVERVGRHDNFFELGGHSLLAVRVISRLRQIYGTDIALNHLFKQPVLAEFADFVLNLQLNAFDFTDLTNLWKTINYP